MFEETVEWLAGQLPQRCDEVWFEDEVYLAFRGEPTWSVWKAFRRDERHCILEVRAIVSEQTPDLATVQQSLLRTWRRFGRADYDVTSCEQYSNAIVLRFVRTGGRGKHKYYFPGRFVVGGGHYQRLFRNMYRQRSRKGKAPFEISWNELAASAELEETIDLEIRQRDHDDDNLVLAQLLDAVSNVRRYGSALQDQTKLQAALYNLILINQLLGSLQRGSLRLPAVSRLHRFGNPTMPPSSQQIREAVDVVLSDVPKFVDEYSRQHLSWQLS
jgi:hypothetical protein